MPLRTHNAGTLRTRGHALLTQAFEARLFIRVSYRNVWGESREDWWTPYLDYASAAAVARERGLALWVEQIPVLALVGPTEVLLVSEDDQPMPLGDLHLPVKLPCSLGEVARAIPAGKILWSPYYLWSVEAPSLVRPSGNQQYRTISVTEGADWQPRIYNPTGVRRIIAALSDA